MEKDIESRLLDTRTPKVAYLVPDGVDAAVLSTALASAGFPHALEIVGGDEYLTVECEPRDRERVRDVIAQVNQHHYAASGLTLGTVRFVDEH